MTLEERLLGDESSLISESESEMCRDDLPMRQRPVKSPRLALGPLILLRAGGVVTGEVEVAEGCTRLGHHLLKPLLILLLVPKVVLLLALSLVAGVVPIVVVVLIGGGVELLPLGAVGDEVGGVTTLEAATRRSPPLLAKSVQRVKLPRQ
jgi:hypothetical protein